MTSLHYRRAGQGAPVLLIHGFCGASDYWTPTIDGLSSRLDLIAPDLPGFGRSNSLPECRSLEEMASQVIALADSLHIPRVGIVGHSMGGFIAQQLLHSRPERLSGAVLYGTAARIDPVKRFESAEQTIERLKRDGVDATAAHVASTWFYAGAANPYYESCRIAARAMTLAAGVAAIEVCAKIDFRDAPKATVPALILLGDAERTFPPDMGIELQRTLGNARLCVLPGCAHAAHLDKPQLFNAVIQDFFLGSAP